MKAMKFIELVNSVHDASNQGLVKGWFNFKQELRNFIEMNGGNTMNIMEMGLIWYLSFLGEEHSATCDSILNTDSTLSEAYVVQKLCEREKRLQSKGKEAANRAARNGNCFKCDKPGHIAINCRSNKGGPGQAESGPSEGSRNRPNRRPGAQGDGTC